MTSAPFGCLNLAREGREKAGRLGLGDSKCLPERVVDCSCLEVDVGPLLYTQESGINISSLKYTILEQGD